MNPESGANKVLIIVAIIVLVIAAGVYWYLKSQPSVSQPSTTANQQGGAALGGNLYNKSSNPVQDKLPSTVAPVTNPIQNLYQNPFQ